MPTPPTRSPRPRLETTELETNLVRRPARRLAASPVRASTSASSRSAKYRSVLEQTPYAPDSSRPRLSLRNECTRLPRPPPRRRRHDRHSSISQAARYWQSSGANKKTLPFAQAKRLSDVDALTDARKSSRAATTRAGRSTPGLQGLQKSVRLPRPRSTSGRQAP
jgi:hypothetical protein